MIKAVSYGLTFVIASPNSAHMNIDLVKEIQGLYGPFILSERVVQKIWLRQDFDTSALTTVCGQTIEVKDPGRWNLLCGPDFKEARLLMDGQPVVGDVEVHLSSSDWYAHQHELNPEFNRVVLHVVLYTDREGAAPIKTLSGVEPPMLVLMPLLERDLEASATDDALLEMEKVEALEWVDTYLEMPVSERHAVVHERAQQRWEQKVQFAAKRLESAGWDEACHQLCLEVLGYSRNRAPMSQIALSYPLQDMAKQSLDADVLYAIQDGNWKLSGSRPANHPRRRLEQYLELLQSDVGWPQRLRTELSKAIAQNLNVASHAVRRSLPFPRSADALRLECFDGIIGAKRFHTMMVDAFLPLATAAGVMDGFPYWLYWWAGDSPVVIRRFLKYAGLTSTQQPLTNGLVQGALALFMNRGA